MTIVELFSFSVEKLLVWISKFNPDRILSAICRAGRSVWNAWRRFFFGINFDKHIWAMEQFMPRMPFYSEQMESVSERLQSDISELSLEDCLEHDFQQLEFYREDVWGEDTPTGAGSQAGNCSDAAVGPTIPEADEEEGPFYGPESRPMTEEEEAAIMDNPHPNTSGLTGLETSDDDTPYLRKQEVRKAYNKKNARNQRTRVKKGYMTAAIKAMSNRLRARHMITDDSMSVVDEAAMRASAGDICASLKINECHTLALIQAAAYLSLVPDSKAIDALKLAYNPQAAHRRSFVSVLRNSTYFGHFSSLEDF